MDLAKAIAVKPTKRQLAWQATEFYGFIHFGMNTMTENEWGDGTEDPALFQPTDLDCRQWVRALKAGGMKGAILTCKHHDGFCLWPSKVTNHTVAASPWRQGKGDVVAEMAAACRESGLKFGIYLSPWDRNHPSYGSGGPYDDFYLAQLTELLTNYGEIFEVWLDGATGSGSKRQQYDWERYFATVRSLQPNAVIAVCGPDVRWIGNEGGATRQEEWSVVPASLQSAERTVSLSQNEDNGFRQTISSSEADLGSRQALANYDGPLVWYPAEVDVSIRPGWFYHPAEDQQVRPAENLWQLYRHAVGGNACLLLNIPPDKSGKIAEVDCQSLERLGSYLAKFNQKNLVNTAKIEGMGTIHYHSENGYLHIQETSLEDENPPAQNRRLSFEWEQPVTLDTITIKERIEAGQRIEKLTILQEVAGTLVPITTCGTIGYQRILDFPAVTTQKIVLEITESRGAISLADIVIADHRHLHL